MNLIDSEYFRDSKPVEGFKGYIQLPPKQFEQISSFLIRNQQRMMEIVGDAPVTLAKPDWLNKLPEGKGVEAWEWNGHIIIEDQASGN